MTTEHSPPDYCAHGEPRGFRYCALCRNSGATLKEEGQARALAAAPSTWRGRAEKTLTELASNGTTFTADDLIALLFEGLLEIKADDRLILREHDSDRHRLPFRATRSFA